MIIVVGVFEVAAEDRQRFLAGKQTQVKTTLAEPGCLDYSFAADAADPRMVRLLERWETMADLEAHLVPPATTPPAVSSIASRMIEASVSEAEPATTPWG